MKGYVAINESGKYLAVLDTVALLGSVRRRLFFHNDLKFAHVFRENNANETNLIGNGFSRIMLDDNSIALSEIVMWIPAIEYTERVVVLHGLSPQSVAKASKSEEPERLVMLAVNKATHKVDYSFLSHDIRSVEEAQQAGFALTDEWEFKPFRIVPV